jgi:hypothetical protein
MGQLRLQLQAVFVSALIDGYLIHVIIRRRVPNNCGHLKLRRASWAIWPSFSVREGANRMVCLLTYFIFEYDGLSG